MSCSFQGIFEDVFKTYPFNNTAGISFWHLNSARFGHTNNVTLLISGTKSQGQDYLWGLIASSILIFAISVVWCILLLAFKCIGPRRVGWLSGRHVPLPPNPGNEQNPNDDNNKVEEGPTAWKNKYNKIIRARTIMKALVVVAGIGIIINAIMLSVKGAKDLTHTLDSIDLVVNYAIGLMEEGVSLIDSVLYTDQQLTNDTKEAWDAINGICPEILQPICTNISDVATCNFDAVLENYTDVVDFLALLATTQDEIYHQLNHSKTDLLNAIAFASSIADISQTFNWAFWCSVGFSMATAFASFFFIYRAIRPPTKKSRCSLRNMFVVPSFVLLAFLSWIFAIVFVIGSIGLADMCYDSPDNNVQALLQRMQSSFSPLIYHSILFYITGCPIGQAATEIVTFMAYLAYFFQSAAAAIQSLNYQNIADECGTGSVARALDATHYVSDSVCQLADLMRDLHVYLECANWYPLYDEGVYQAMCYQGTSGFVWVTSTQIAIVVCSMVILSLRVVFHEIDIEDPKSSPESLEDKQEGVNGDESAAKDTTADEEQTFATVIADQRDDVPDKNEMQIVESVPIRNMLDDDQKEVLTVPLDDSETTEGDNGNVVVRSQLADQDPDPSTFTEEDRVHAADDNDAPTTKPLDDLETEADGLEESVKSQEKVLDETKGTTSIVEDDKAQAAPQDDVVLIPDATEIEEEVVPDLVIAGEVAAKVESHDDSEPIVIPE